jgi:hypothetical protein
VSDPLPPQQAGLPVLQVKVSQGDFTNHGRRNELVGVNENNGTKTMYTEGDDRYFAWYWYIPNDNRFPIVPPVGTPAWHVFFQFHEQGNCGCCDPVMPFALNKNPTGSAYNITFNYKDYYDVSGDAIRLWTSPDLGSPQFPVGVWHYFVLHIYFSQTACSNGTPCTWFAPNGGVYELWVDRQYMGSWARKTLYTWPPSPLCPDDNGFPTSGPMPNYLKTGIYRDLNITYDETWFLNGLIVGTTCADVWGLPAAPTCPRF